MDLMKKAAAAITHTDSDSHDPSETNPYTREVHRNGAVMLDCAASESAKEAAIKTLGFVGYLGKRIH